MLTRKYSQPFHVVKFCHKIRSLHSSVNCCNERQSKETPFPAASYRESFRNGIVECDKTLLNHIFHYLLSKRNDLVKRAYLARYLVRIEVSPEVEGDNDIVTLFQQVSDTIEWTFLLLHS